MERIEIPAEVYFKSNDGKKFRLQTECEKWEVLNGKWSNPVRYREFENEDGQLCYAFWVESKEELEDALWFFNKKQHACTRGCTYFKEFKPQWIVVYPYYDGYSSDFMAEPIDTYRTTLDETLKAVQDTLSEVIKMIWEKAR